MSQRINQVIRESFNAADARDDEGINAGMANTPNYNPIEGDGIQIASGDHAGKQGHIYQSEGDQHSVMDEGGNHLGVFHSKNLAPQDAAAGGYTTTEMGATGAFTEALVAEDGEGGNTVGGGAIAGAGVTNPTIPNQAEPGVNRKKKSAMTVLMNLTRKQMNVPS